MPEPRVFTPGKFSTMLVVVSKPPGCWPVSTSGFKFARAV